MESKDMLAVSKLTKRFGGLTALSQIDFSVPRGEILGIIGPNGAGKTTIFNLVTNMYRPDEGSILLDGADITRMKTYQICRTGVGRTFQVVKFFGALSVWDNVVAAAFCHINRREEAREEALAVLERVGLASRKDVMPRSLTIADKKHLELAKALATRPKLLLLDEIMAGLNPAETDRTIALIKTLQKEGYTIVIVEHVMQAIMALSNRIIVLNFGEKIAEGSPDEIAQNPEVVKAYLGVQYAATRNKRN
jgi:branched-chain amino acid transport system ATP-binding protein